MRRPREIARTTHGAEVRGFAGRCLAACRPAALVVCAVGLPASASPIGPVSGIVVEASGIGPAHEDCAAFVVTPEEVEGFLERAIVVTGRQEHDFFLHGPCVAQGTLRTPYDVWQWQLRSMGTGTVTAGNGDLFRLADPAEAVPPGDDQPR